MPVYNKNGIGYPHAPYEAHPDVDNHANYYGNYYGKGSYGQDLAYRGYQHYQ